MNTQTYRQHMHFNQHKSYSPIARTLPLRARLIQINCFYNLAYFITGRHVNTKNVGPSLYSNQYCPHGKEKELWKQ